MKSTAGIRHTNKPDIVHLSSPLTTGTLGEIYDAVRYKNGNTIVRAGKDPVDQWYVYMPKKENKLAASTYKAASIQCHRQAMADLLIQSSDVINASDWVSLEQRKMIMALRCQVVKKDIVHADFSAREIAGTLKPLSNQIRTRKRLEKTSAIKSAKSPSLKTRKDYLRLFLTMSDSDLQILRSALFPTEKAISFEEQKLILRSIFSLIRVYLKKGDNSHTLADLVRHNPHKDLLLKFSKAWLDHIKKSQTSRHPNLLVVFNWQKTMSSICESIVDVATEKSNSPLELTSPDRSTVFQKKFDRSRTGMDGREDDSPTKLPSLPVTPLPSPVAVSIPSGSLLSKPATLQALGKFTLGEDAAEHAENFVKTPEVTAQPTSAVSLPDIDDAVIVTVDSQASGSNEAARV